MIAATVQSDIDGIPKGPHSVSLPVRNHRVTTVLWNSREPGASNSIRVVDLFLRSCAPFGGPSLRRADKPSGLNEHAWRKDEKRQRSWRFSLAHNQPMGLMRTPPRMWKIRSPIARSGHHGRHIRVGLPRNIFDDLAVENASQTHQHLGGTCWAAARAVANAVAVLTEISRGKRHMERHGGHRFTCSF